MGFIVEGFLGLALLAGLIWLAFYLRTRKQEVARWRSEEREAEQERLLQTHGEPLYCIACQKLFEGPMPDQGCPHCHCTSFVTPDRFRAPAADTQAINRLRRRA